MSVNRGPGTPGWSKDRRNSGNKSSIKNSRPMVVGGRPTNPTGNMNSYQGEHMATMGRPSSGGGQMQVNLNNLMGTLLTNLEQNLMQRQGGDGEFHDQLDNVKKEYY
jgi:hypothetical protein